MLILSFIGTIDYFIEILEEWCLINVVIVATAIYRLVYMLKHLLKSIFVQGQTKFALNLS